MAAAINRLGGADGAEAAIAWELRGLRDRTEYLDCMLVLLSRLIPNDAISWNSVDTTTGAAEVYGNPADMHQNNPLPADLLIEIPDHPMVLSYLDASQPGNRHDLTPRRMSDVTTTRELKKTRAYNELLRPLGMENQLTILTAHPTPQSGGCWTFGRTSHDFAAEDLALASRIQPLLVSLTRSEPHLTTAFIDNVAIAGTDLGITPRQAEVLGYVATGLTAAAIGRCLAISERTVRKHLEYAYKKLGTSDRLTAVDRARHAGLIPPASPAAVRTTDMLASSDGHRLGR